MRDLPAQAPLRLLPHGPPRPARRARRPFAATRSSAARSRRWARAWRAPAPTPSWRPRCSTRPSWSGATSAASTPPPGRSSCSPAQVVDYWQDRWRAELRPEEMALADGVAGIQRQIVAVSDSVFHLADAGHREEALPARPARAQGPAAARAHPDEPGDLSPRPRVERAGRLQPAGGDPGGRGPHAGGHHRALARGRACAASWLISRSLARPVARADAAPWRWSAAGELDHPIQATSRDEIGDLARALARMTGASSASRAAAAGAGGEARLHR